MKASADGGGRVVVWLIQLSQSNYFTMVRVRPLSRRSVNHGTAVTNVPFTFIPSFLAARDAFNRGPSSSSLREAEPLLRHQASPIPPFDAVQIHGQEGVQGAPPMPPGEQPIHPFLFLENFARRTFLPALHFLH